METKTKITFDKKEIDVLLSVIDMLEFQDWMNGCCYDDEIRVMNEFIRKLREADKIQLFIKDKE